MKEKASIFEPIASRRIFEEVSDRIKQLVFDGKLVPGDQLPTENALAVQFDVSRSTIREALRLLEISGIIRISRAGNRRPVISDTIFHRISQLYLDAFRLKRFTLAELTVVRLDIEKNIIDRLFDRFDSVDPELLDKLQASIKSANLKLKKRIRPTEENLDFHRLLSECTGNHVYIIIIESLMAVLGDILSRLAPDYDTSAKVVADHEQIMQAILAKDRKKTLALMEHHLLEVESRLQ